MLNKHNTTLMESPPSTLRSRENEIIPGREIDHRNVYRTWLVRPSHSICIINASHVKKIQNNV